MQELFAVIRIASLTLALFQAVQLLFRLPAIPRLGGAGLQAARGRRALRPGRRGGAPRPTQGYFPLAGRGAEWAGFLFILLVVGLRAGLPGPPLRRQVLDLALLWIGGLYLGRMAGEARRSLWNLALAVLAGVFLLLGWLGFYGTPPFQAFTLFCILLAALYPLRLLARLWADTRSAAFLYFMALGLLWVPAGAYDYSFRSAGLPELNLTLWLSLLFLAGTGYLLSVENYLQGASWTGLARRLGLQENRIRSARYRLIQTEHTLLLQDRLIASGLLAAGAAHEFKNILSSIAAAAEYGLDRETRASGAPGSGRRADAVRRALEAVARSAEIGRRVVTELLERLVQQGRPRPEPIRLREELAVLLELVRASYRPEGIRVLPEIREDLAVFCRRGELEQVLLNLIHNATESLRRKPRLSERTIRLYARRSAGEGVQLEVTDNGRGVPAELAERIFEYSFSTEGSSGLGLYLSRMLVERNGGVLECIPRPEGGCFRITLPSAPAPAPAPPDGTDPALPAHPVSPRQGGAESS